MSLDKSQYTAICFEFLGYQMIFLHGRHRVLVEGSPVKHCLYVIICSNYLFKEVKANYLTFYDKVLLRIFFLRIVLFMDFQIKMAPKIVSLFKLPEVLITLRGMYLL